MNEYEQLSKMSVEQLLVNGIESAFTIFDEKSKDKRYFLDQVHVELSLENPWNLSAREVEKAVVEAIGSSISQPTPAKKGKSTVTENEETTADAVFVHFLQYGQMPWFSQSSSDIKIADLPLNNSSYASGIQKLLGEQVLARHRLVAQFNRNEILLLLQKLYPPFSIQEFQEVFEWFSTNVSSFSDRFGAAYKLEKALLLQMIELLTGLQKPFSGTADLFGHLSIKWPAICKSILNGGHEIFLNKMKERFNFPEKGLKLSNSGSVKMRKGQPDEEEFLEKFWNEHNKNEQYQVQNAGLILLHPFLFRFFMNTGLLENKKFISRDHQERGVCLLYFLATGRLEFPEEELVLAKFLCGLPVHHTIPRELPVSRFEIEEAQAVLQSAISHWPTLKNTSPEGLRQNFLRRKGLLEKDEIGFLLRVEKHTADILLSRLPWKLSMAQFPWLDHFIIIKWH